MTVYRYRGYKTAEMCPCCQIFRIICEGLLGNLCIFGLVYDMNHIFLQLHKAQDIAIIQRVK